MKYLNFGDAVKLWYLFMYMNQVASMEKLKYYHSVEKLYHEISDFYTRFTKKLADIIYDYIIYTASIESTHAVANNWVTFDTMFTYPIEIARRHKDEFYRIDPIRFLESALVLFEDNWENDIYGGYCWYKACKLAFDRKSDILFIDATVDLEHNTGSLFNKNNPFFTPFTTVPKWFLDGKTERVGIVELGCYLINQNSSVWNLEVRSLVKRFYFLCLKRLNSGGNDIERVPFLMIDTIEEEIQDLAFKNATINNVLNYTPVKFTYEQYRFNIIDSDDLPSQQYAKKYDEEQYW